MKHFFRIFLGFVLMVASAGQASAQIKDGEATVTQGSTATVSIGAAYASTLAMATGVSATWTTGSSAISIQSRTNTSCTIKGNTVGTAKLYFNCSYYIDGYRRTMNFYYDITIKANVILVTRIDMSPETATMEIGETLRLDATAYPTTATNRNLNWTTENYNVASVSSSGLVTARGAGRVKVWARAKDGSGAGNYCVIDVNEPTKVGSIALSENEKTLTVGEKFELSATVLPDDASDKSLTWASDDEEIATVGGGVVTALSAGECNITCAAADGSNVSATCHVTVREPERCWLSVVVPNGNFSVDVTDLNPVSVKITPDEGYVVNSVTLDGVELSHDGGVIVLPGLTRSATLNIVFAAGTQTGVESVSGGSEPLRVVVANHTVTVKGRKAGQFVYVYDAVGTLIKSATRDVFELPDAGIYVLRIGTGSFKLAVQ